MEYIFCIVAGVIAFAVGIVSMIWAVKNYQKQMTAVNGVNYRREHGLFDFEQYTRGVIPSTVSRRQKDNRPDPESYGEKVSFVNHFE